MDSEDVSFWTPVILGAIALAVIAQVFTAVKQVHRDVPVVYGIYQAYKTQEKVLPQTPISPMELRKVVAVIDTGIDMSHPVLKPFLCNGGHRDFVGTGLNDTHGHGTHIAGLVMKGLDPTKYCVMALKYYDNSGNGYLNLEHEVEALEWANQQHAYLVNLSGGGVDESGKETAAVNALLKRGTVLVFAAGNDGHVLGAGASCTYYYPACAAKSPNLHVVGALNKAGKPLPSSNFGDAVTDWAQGLMQLSTLPGGKYGTMSGTSQATANVSNRLLGGKGESWTSP